VPKENQDNILKAIQSPPESAGVHVSGLIHTTNHALKGKFSPSSAARLKLWTARAFYFHSLNT
jgi:hypothetical protein